MGSRQFEEIPVTTMANGQRFTLPLHRITGSQPGPTLGMVALIHGDEPLPNAILRRVVQEVDLNKLKGSLLILPVANPLAYENQTRHTPLDGINLNRYFPGGPNGYITEQIAHILVTKFLPQVQYVIDFHSGGIYPTVDYVYLSKLQPEMSKAFGSSLLYSGGGFRGTFSGTAEEKNVPTVVVEIGGGGILDAPYIERGVQGAFNVMKYLKMIEGAPILPAKQTVFTQLTYLHPQTAGALYPELPLDQLGKIVPGGTVLGRVVSPYTFEELEVLKAPHQRNYMILARGFIARVNPGDFAYMCANADVP
jgi:uncharacterized protein